MSGRAGGLAGPSDAVWAIGAELNEEEIALTPPGAFHYQRGIAALCRRRGR